MLLHSDTKRVRRVQHPELNIALYDWFLRFEKQVPMSGGLIKGKASIIFIHKLDPCSRDTTQNFYKCITPLIA